MGIIKTAMMAGAGMYAVNKLAQTAQSRRTNPAPAQQQQQQYLDAPQNYNQGQGGQQQQQQQQRVVPMEFTDRRSSDQKPGQPLLLSNNNYSSVPTYGYNAEGGYYYEIDPRANSAPAPQMAYADGRGSPPPPQYQNAPQQQRQQGYVEPAEVSESGFGGSGSGGMAFLNNLVQQGMSGKDGRGKDFISKFMK